MKKTLTEDDYLDAAKAQLELVNPENDVRGNITLPSEFVIDETDETAYVTWKSSNPEIVTDTEKDGKPAGVVTRQDKDTDVRHDSQPSKWTARQQRKTLYLK